MSPLVLPRSGILAYMDDESRERLSTYGQAVTTRVGEVLIREGDVNQKLFVVLEGTFSITTESSGSLVQLDTVGIGDCLGEVAIFHPDQASATVTSVEAGRLWNIEVGALQQFLFDWPNDGCAAILGINIILSRRLRHANEVIKRNEILPAFLSVRSGRTQVIPLPQHLRGK